MRVSDLVLKWVVLLIASLWLYVYWERRDVGRYTILESHDEQAAETIVLDSRTGVYWTVGTLNGTLLDAEINPRSASATARKIEKLHH